VLGGELSVARIGYGTMKLTGWPRGDRPGRETALAVLRRAVELGVNHIDTSYYYSRDGVSANELIREALHPYPDDLLIVTKVGALVEGSDLALPAAEKTGLTPGNLRRGVEANLRSLGVDRLDVVNLRMGDVGPGGTPLAGPLETLLALREEGLIRQLGVSNVTADEFGQACAIAPIACVQNLYNPSFRSAGSGRSQPHIWTRWPPGMARPCRRWRWRGCWPDRRTSCRFPAPVRLSTWRRTSPPGSSA
jgi:aryl-alcohol dehydrogenase-like predicted oxidoreductase